MAYNDNFADIFYKAKDGDCVGFYRGGLFSLIPLATGGDVNHVGQIFRVSRTETECSFNFAEQTFEGGKFDRITIHKTGDGKFITDNPYWVKQDAIHYASLKKELTPWQIETAIADAESQVGKVYGYAELFLGFEFLEKILPQAIKNWIFKYSKSMRRVCCTSICFRLRKIKVSIPKDFFPTPIETMRLDQFEPVKSLR